MTNDNTQTPLDRLLDAAKEESLRRIQNPNPLSVESVTRDIEKLKARRRELDGKKRELARAVASRDEAATKEFSGILAEQSALDLDEEVLVSVLASLREEEHRETLRANAAQIDEHRRRAGVVADQIVGYAADLERAVAQVFEAMTKLGESERSLHSELRQGQVRPGAGLPSIVAYASDRLGSRIAGRFTPTFDRPTDERAEAYVSRYRSLPSVLDGIDV